MLVPVEWIREYTDFDLSAEELADRLTMAGLEVEEIVEAAGQKVFSTYVTPNRPDQLSIVGVARQVSALLNSPFKPPKPVLKESNRKASDLAKVDIESPVNCPRYSARLVLDIKVGESPDWMKERLIAAGLRPINNIVDATNYVLIELGQPLHAFDYDLVKDHHIIVRQARPGEKTVTLDGEERDLTPDMLVIADPGGAVAVAGVMGGLDTEVSAKTTNVLLESAHFDRLSIRRTARDLQLATEASYRFERGVDPELTVYALDRVAELIQQTAGGETAEGVVDAYPLKIEPTVVSIRPKRAGDLLGVEVGADDVKDYLTRLGMKVGNLQDGKFQVVVPTFRPDVLREEDLIEEVGTIYGYDRIPEKAVVGETMQGRDSAQGEFASQVAKVLISSGLQEVVTGSMSPPSGKGQVEIRNPLNDELSRLRKHLILDLLSVMSYNASRGIRQIGIFQIGRVFEPQDDSLIIEKMSVGGALSGSTWDETWNVDRTALEADFFFCKGIVENLLDNLGVQDVLFKSTKSDLFHPGRAAVIEAGGAELGAIGQISADTARRNEIPERTYVFELDFDELMDRSTGIVTYTPISRYPAVTRDLAVVVPDATPYHEVKELLVKGAGELLESLSLFDVYTGPPLLAGQKSLAFGIVFRSHERTLRDETVDDRLSRMRQLLTSELGASFRDT